MTTYNYAWLDNFTPIRVQPRELATEDFNIIRLGILRLGKPLYIELDDIKGLRCILDDTAWIFIDRFLDTMPLLAWTDFQPRESINVSIACELRLYQMHAGLLISRSLDAVQKNIREQMQQKYGDFSDEVIKLDR